MGRRPVATVSDGCPRSHGTATSAHLTVIGRDHGLENGSVETCISGSCRVLNWPRTGPATAPADGIVDELVKDEKNRIGHS